MPMISAPDGTPLYVKDWGEGRPVVLIHGWPLNADSWEVQALGLAEAGHRVISFDRRGFGRSGQSWSGYDYDTMAGDLAAVIEGLDLSEAALVGFSMGGGEVARYFSRGDAGRVTKAAFISSVAPGLLKSDANPDGAPAELFEEMRDGLRRDRPAFLQDFFKQFYGQGVFSGGVSQAVLDWTQGMALMASPRATLDCVTAFGMTDFTADVARISVPTLVVHGTADNIVPIDATARRMAKMVPQAQLIEYDGAPHGLGVTHAERLLDDLKAFLA